MLEELVYKGCAGDAGIGIEVAERVAAVLDVSHPLVAGPSPDEGRSSGEKLYACVVDMVAVEAALSLD